MPTPVVISELGKGPLDHIPEHERWTPREVFYMTTRQRDPDLRRVFYTNQEADYRSVGLALVEFGDPNVDWETLNELSRVPLRDEDVPLSISGICGIQDRGEKGFVRPGIESNPCDRWH